MRSAVTIIFNSRQSLELSTDVEPGGQASIAARDWFDSTWTRLGCEPLRPSGKVLLLDKILGVADALGYTGLSHDEQQAAEYARSEERRVGKECVSTCRCRWSPIH